MAPKLWLVTCLLVLCKLLQPCFSGGFGTKAVRHHHSGSLLAHQIFLRTFLKYLNLTLKLKLREKLKHF